MTNKVKCALGLMSGTSLDGIDAAIIYTDGEKVTKTGSALTLPYPASFREALAALLKGEGNAGKIERELTLRHSEAVTALLSKAGLSPNEIDVIGFHGQTILHRPEEAITWQIGDGNLLAHLTGIDVIADFRRRDVAAGGQGAPLVPLYHAAVTSHLPHPLAIVNIGGVANVTWIGEKPDHIIAFDTGPGNALLDDWVGRHTGRYVDEGGKIAAKGLVNDAVVGLWLSHEFFKKKPPKSLDRHSFSLESLQHSSLEDGAATLTAFTARAIALAGAFFPEAPKSWLITGGGRHNPTLMRAISHAIGKEVVSIETIGLDGDMLEAQSFAFLAVRSLYGLPLSLPGTTGVTQPVTGGAFYRASLSSA